MPGIRHWLARLRAVVRRDVVAGEIREELQIHLDMRAEDLERQGLPRVEARRQAARRFGSVALHQDRGYDIRGGGVMETIIQDLRYSVRLFWTHRGFSFVAVATLALGVGLCTALFSVIHAAILRPLPYPDPQQLVRVNVVVPGRGEAGEFAPSLDDVRTWRADQRVFRQIAVDRGASDVIVDTGYPERVPVQQVSEGFLEVLGVAPSLGRSFSAEDTRREIPLVALLGHGYSQTRFGGDRGVLGRQIRIAGESATIVGILPAGFYPRVAVWQPFPRRPAGFESMRGTGAPVIGRLQPGLSRARAESSLSQIVDVLDTAHGKPAGTSVRMYSHYDETVEGSGPIVWTLAGAVAAILLIACVNVAGLLLARGATRQRELAIRASIGAGRVRLIRQLLSESVMLAAAGGLAGIVLAWVSLDALVAILPLALPENATPSLNVEVLAFSVIVAVFTSLLFGLVPALRLSRVNLNTTLAASDRRSGAPLSRRSGQWLIAIEVALGVVLLAGAGLMIRSFARLVSVDLGYNPDAFLTMEVSPLDPSPAVAAQYYPALVEAVRRLPEVEAAGAADQLPIGGSRRAGFVTVPEQQPIRVDERQVLPGFFEAIGLPLKAGRLPTEADRTAGRPLVVINELTARRIFPGVSPVGRLLPLGKEPPEIIGVVGDFLQDGARSPVRANVYFVYQGYAELRRQPFVVFVRPRGAPSALVARLRDAAHSVGPRVLIDRIRSGDDFVSESVTVPRRRMVLLGLLGGIGLVLTVVGIFSMTAYAVVRRTREIGVRMAFGATSGHVVRTMVRDTAWPVSLGLAAGIGGAYLTTRVIATLLFETTPHDAGAFAAALATLGVSAIVAAWLPARRAARVDPVVALRSD
ncbi:MAG TPA: ABC transporter permease [Vicinamibacterales bacterium]|nr:ABC transporter permease [Vicinamibacterales bacterium]